MSLFASRKATLIRTEYSGIGTMKSSHHCLSPEQVNLFLDGQLTEDVDREIIHHLDHCSHCRQALDDTAGSGEFAGSIKQFLSDDAISLAGANSGVLSPDRSPLAADEQG